MTEEPEALLKRKRLLLVKLFEFLRAYTNLRFPPIREINKQSKTLWLKDLPSHPSVELVQLPSSSDDRIEDADVVLRLTRPASTPCPAPPQVLSEWLKPGWQEPSNKVEIRTSRNVIGKHGNTSIERFDDLAERLVALQAWNKQREQWVTNERPTREALAIFRDVYEWYGIQEREGEKVELLLGDGLLHCGEGENAFHHPVLLQKVELDFYPEKKSPQFIFRRREQPPELYMEFLRALPDVNNQQLARCADELKETEFSPLGKEDTTGFLRRLIQGLFPKDGSFVEHVRPEVKEEMGSQSDAAGSSSEERRFTAGQGGPIIERQPVIFMRNRHTGPSNVFELVLEDIASRDVFPASLLQILGF